MARNRNELDENKVDAPDRRRLPPLLRTAWYSLNQAFRRRIHHLGITPDQFTVLRWLSEGEAGGMTQRTLADLMASDPNTVTSILQRMEEAGLLERHSHESDKRAKRVCLKPAGAKVYEQARQIALELQTGVLSALPQEQREDFLERLERIAIAAHLTAEG